MVENKGTPLTTTKNMTAEQLIRINLICITTCYVHSWKAKWTKRNETTQNNMQDFIPIQKTSHGETTNGWQARSDATPRAILNPIDPNDQRSPIRADQNNDCLISQSVRQWHEKETIKGGEQGRKPAQPRDLFKIPQCAKKKASYILHFHAV